MKLLRKFIYLWGIYKRSFIYLKYFFTIFTYFFPNLFFIPLFIINMADDIENFIIAISLINGFFVVWTWYISFKNLQETKQILENIKKYDHVIEMWNTVKNMHLPKESNSEYIIIKK